MKVLITGMTARTVGKYDPLNPATDREDRRIYLVGCQAFAWAVRELGHEVEYRPVDPLESLRGFDRAVVFVGPLVDPSFVYLHGGLAALARRPDAILGLDDWKIGTILSAFRRCTKWNYHYLWHSTFARSRKLRNVAFENPIGRKIERLVERMAEPGPWKYRMFIPVFPWGEARKLKGVPLAEEMVGLDYSPAMVAPKDLRNVVAIAEKRRAWMFAAMGLRPWVDRQGYRWPLVRAGYDAPRVSEHVVLRAAARVWGYIAAKYPHAAGGWWRPRFVHSAWTRSVLHCDPTEATARRAPELYGQKASVLEAMTDSQLRELADAQAKFIRRNTWSKDQLLHAVERVLA